MAEPRVHKATPEELRKAATIGVGFGAFRQAWEELQTGPEARLLQSAREALQSPESLRETFRSAFRGAERTESKLIAGGLGALTAAGREAANLFDLLGGAVSPAGIPSALIQDVTGERPSNLFRASLSDQGPLSEAAESMMEEFDSAFTQYGSAEFGKFVGEWVPAIMGGSILAGPMRRIMIKEGPQLLSTLGRRKLFNEFMPRAAKAMMEAGDSTTALRALREAGTVTGGLTWMERGLMAAGNGMGFGAYEGTRSIAGGAPAGEAAKTAGLVSAFGAGGEIALAAVGRALFPSFRKGLVDTRVLQERAERVLPEVERAIVSGDMSRLVRLTNDVSKSFEIPGGYDFLTRGEKAYGHLVDDGIIDIVDGMVKIDPTANPELRAVRLGKMVRQLEKQSHNWEEYLAKQMGLGSQAPYWGGTEETARKAFIEYVGKIRELERDLIGAGANVRGIREGWSSLPILRRAWNDSPVCPQQLLHEAEGLYEAAVSSGYTWDKIRLGIRKAWLSPYANFLEDVKVRYFSSPDGLSRQLGVSGLKFASEIEEWNMAARAQRIRIHQGLDTLEQRLKKMGVDPKELRQLHESSSVGSKYVGEVRDLWSQHVEVPLAHYGTELEQRGVTSLMSESELRALGVEGKYFPHVVKRFVDSSNAERKIQLALRRQGMNESQIEDVLQKGGWRASGAKKFGTIDFQRTSPGTTEAKLAQGIPLEDNPIQALKDHFDQVIMRLEGAKRFGPNWERGMAYKAAMMAEGGSERAANMLVDSALFQRTPDSYFARLARNITASQIVLKLAWAAIPNTFQSAMTGIRFGMKATGKGIYEANRDILSNARVWNADMRRAIASHDKGDIANAMEFLERSLLSSATVMENQQSRTLMEKVAEISLRGTMFNMTERMNRMIAAHAALADARWTINRFAMGELRGQAAINARAGMDSLGIDIDKVLARHATGGRLGLSAQEVDRVIVNGVKQTQFSTGVLDVPASWRTPMGRIAMQFKSFAFNAGRLTRDQVMREFDNGNYRPLLYFLGLGGLSGEAIGMFSDVAKGRERDIPNGPWRVVEDLSNFGGFGLVKTIVDSALYGEPLEALAGPMASDIAGITTDVVMAGKTGKPSKLLDTLSRQPVAKLAKRASGLLWYGVDGAADALQKGWDWDLEPPQERQPGEPMRFEDWQRKMRNELGTGRQ